MIRCLARVLSRALADLSTEARLGRRAAAWLCLLGPFFFASYGAANWLAAQRTHVGWVVFAWEYSIPFATMIG